MNRDSLFDRKNLHQIELAGIRAHDGEGLIRFARVVERTALAGACNFIDLAELPPGTSVGLHSHGSSEEEFYLILAGAGEMTRNGEVFEVEAGDLIRNPPGGTHALRNTGDQPLKMLVFELEVRA